MEFAALFEMSSDKVLLIEEKHPYTKPYRREEVFVSDPGWYELQHAHPANIEFANKKRELFFDSSLI
jgi:hypothetical protein